MDCGCGTLHKADEELGGLTLAQFIAAEKQVLAIWKKRIKVLTAEIPDWVREEYEAGNILRAAGYIRNSLRVAWSDAEMAEARRVHLTLLTMGAKAVAPRLASPWRNPNETDAALVESALRQFVDSEEELLMAMSDGLYREGMLALNPEPVRKLDPDLIPIDFGYKPDMSAPPWAKGLDAAAEKGITSSTLSANLTTSRLVNYGALDGMEKGGITSYRIKAKLDDRTSEVCRTLNGRVFKVGEGADRLKRALTSRKASALKDVHPWVRSTDVGQLGKMTVDELRNKGYTVPPFHPHCRTVVVRATSAKAVPEAEQAAAAAEQLMEVPASRGYYAPVGQDNPLAPSKETALAYAAAIKDLPKGTYSSAGIEQVANARLVPSLFDSTAKHALYREVDLGLDEAKALNISLARRAPDDQQSEWLIVYDAKGKQLGTPNEGTREGVGPSLSQQGHLSAAARSDPRSLVVHHNHPEVSRGQRLAFALSPEDYKFLVGNKAVRALYAHVDESTSFRAAWSPVMDEDWFAPAFQRIHEELWGSAGTKLVETMRAIRVTYLRNRVTEMDVYALAQLAYGNVLRTELGMQVDFWGERLQEYMTLNYRAFHILEARMTIDIRRILAEIPGAPVRKAERKDLVLEMDDQREYMAGLIAADPPTTQQINDILDEAENLLT